MAFMAAILPAIMALGHGAAAAGASAAGAAGSAGATGGAAAGAAGAGTAAGAGLAGAGAGTVGAAMPAVGSAAGISADGSLATLATKAPSLLDKADVFMQRPSVKAGQDILNSMMKGAGGGGGVPNNQPGEQVENPIAPSPSFPGGDSAMPQPLMPGMMDNPFGAPSQRALIESMRRGG